MLSLSGDNITSTTRNIIFLITTAIIFGCFLGLYFELQENVRNEALFLSLLIVSSIAFTVFLIIVVVDSIKNRDYQIANNKKIERDKEYEDLKNGLPRTSEEIPKTLVGRDKIYYNNSFETTGNLWRTIVFAVIALTVFSSTWITYTKHPSEKKNNAIFIIAVIIATLAMSSHVGLLIYQFYEFLKLNKKKTIPNISRYQTDREFQDNIKSKDIL